MMWNFLFEITTEGSDCEGEQFFVQAKGLTEAEEIIDMWFEDENYCYHGRFTDEEAEAMGLDTY